ncbi:type II toxin-antitoxin system VapC family toxin [Mycobacterium kansasii]|uniref:Ribonuclease VapC n=3 Tax=Mycobacterium kansasii TaxID=1768 RepID=A0A653EQY8_MYCKA|nr:type II toxin-antitoxin system VapC family toxin [Mycobacterium kansasii]AGZ53449.1 ribonuclease [Mycobacterium kansasii ATCC 12478]ARG54951.1 VapC toxin family PIN domain ribonuclease [Mycobacterium kansasii]ARG60403.1 VapC toxin family PIN domain ribonuclease [Mycobacterium kansasii]ARG68083.1 VapC toxin family PIN domain ribonuclease [Mycobacterium kansasii]ARG77272.1 VapC toxin family PIN domain ribonuclease [Mycobacterium kansasii]
MIYLDTSALTKLLIAEPETDELRNWLTVHTDQGEFAATSALSRVELMRVVARQGESGQAERARYLLDGLDILPLTAPVINLAETIGPATLRTLDAIHLAAATQIKRELTAFVTYDHRLLAGCLEVGLVTASPGAVR